MKRENHAIEITNRFREIIEQSGETLNEVHYDELSLLIEAGIDTALVEMMEKLADKLNGLAHEVRHDAEFFK